MEEKESLLKTIEDVNDDETVMQEWILEENARLKYEGQMSYAREEGIQEGIQKGIEQGIQEEKLETIKNILKKGLDYQTISEVTGKTTIEIEEIARNIDKG